MVRLQAVVMAFVPLLIAATDTPTRDWAALLRGDAQAFHDQVKANHPGPYNTLDPGFTRLNDAGLALALRRAGQVRSYGGYLAAMRGYVAGFNDGHLALDVTQPEPLPLAWPGFLTGFDEAGRQVVRTRVDDIDLPVGARLEQCDGVTAATLAARNVGAFRGRWQLASQRATQGGRLFIDAGNPFIARPRRCRFMVGGMAHDVVLAWRPLPDAEFDRHFAATAPRARPDFGARTLANGTRWFSMRSFDGDPGSDTAKALVPMIADMKRDRAQVVAAPKIVLDLRGNGGGSSDWSRQIAVILWGQAAVDAAESRSTSVDWRASAGNLATIEGYRAAWRVSTDVSPEAKAWADRTAAGLATALAHGEPLWREPDEDEAHAGKAAPSAVPAARIFVLTDWGCGSACLDAVDLWTALGATQIGQETSADSLYMDIRQVALPSGFARAVIPMKVYRGRRRGSNVPAVPARRYTGDMRDTASLEGWVATL